MLRRSQQRVASAHDGWDFDEFDAAARRQMLIAAVGQAATLLMRVAGWPALLWLSVRLCRVAGAGVEIVGFWPTAVGCWAVTALAGRIVGSLDLATRNGRARVPWNLIEMALCLVALSIGVLFGVIDIEPGPVWRQMLTLVALAAVGYMWYFWLTLPWLTLVIQLVINGLRLFLLGLASSVMDSSLSFSGVGQFLLATLILTMVTWPAFVGQVRANRRPVVHDPFWPHDPLLAHGLFWPPRY
jgi:hypothetical protein